MDYPNIFQHIKKQLEDIQTSPDHGDADIPAGATPFNAYSAALSGLIAKLGRKYANRSDFPFVRPCSAS